MIGFEVKMGNSLVQFKILFTFTWVNMLKLSTELKY